MSAVGKVTVEQVKAAYAEVMPWVNFHPAALQERADFFNEVSDPEREMWLYAEREASDAEAESKAAAYERSFC